MAQPSFDRDALNDIFLRAFKDCTKGIVNSLSTDANDQATTTAIQTIAAQLNYDHSRLVYVVDIIQALVYQEKTWTDAAVTVYDMIASNPHELMKALQTQFTSMMAVDTWSTGFTFFLAQLCQRKDSIGRLTPGIMLHIISGMIESTKLFNDDNLGLLFEVINAAGPVLDVEALEVVNEFGRKLQRLQKRIRERGDVVVMAVFGLMRLRELGWNAKSSERT